MTDTIREELEALASRLEPSDRPLILSLLARMERAENELARRADIDTRLSILGGWEFDHVRVAVGVERADATLAIRLHVLTPWNPAGIAGPGGLSDPQLHASLIQYRGVGNDEQAERLCREAGEAIGGQIFGPLLLARLAEAVKGTQPLPETPLPRESEYWRCGKCGEAALPKTLFPKLKGSEADVRCRRCELSEAE